MRYDAFLSYSHALDGRLAPALQRGLQRFGRRWHAPRALRIFRDETNLATSPHLWASIETALAHSRYFILLASPHAADSPWVGRETAWWLANRSPEELLIVLTEGVLAWAADGRLRSDALPPALVSSLTAEPRFLDLRWARNEAIDLDLQHNRFRDAVADLAATLHGRDKDELIGEEVRQHRRLRRLRLAAMAGLATLTLAASGTAYWAVRQQREAERQQAVAERNFGTALDAADAMVSEVAATLTDLQGVSKARVAAILTEAERLFARLSESDGERRALLDRQAGLLLAFSRAFMEMGDPAGSLARAEEAMERLDRAAALPGEPAAQELDARRASGLFLMGLAQQSLVDTATALATFEQARALYARILTGGPERADWLAEYAEAHYYVAMVRFQRGDLTAAMEIGEAGMALMRRALALEPDKQRWRRDLAVGNTGLAMGYRLQGRLAEAEAALSEAAEVLATLTADDPDNLDLKQSLAATHQQLAGLAADRFEWAAAGAHLEQARGLFAEMMRRDPANVTVAGAYAAATLELGGTLEARGDGVAAANTYAQSLAVFEQVLSVNPDSAPLEQLAVSVATALARLGGEGVDAQLGAFQSAADTLDRLLARDPENVVLKVQAASLEIARAGVLAGSGQLSAAIEGFDAGLGLYRDLLQRDPGNAEYLEGQLGALFLAGTALREQGASERARNYLERAMVIAEAAARRMPMHPPWASLYEDAARALTGLLADQGDGAGAASLRERRLAFLTRQMAAAPEEAWPIRLAGELRLDMGWAADRAGDETGARRHFEAALALARTLVRLAPDAGESWRLQALAAEAQALADLDEGALPLLDLAIESYRQALRRQEQDRSLRAELSADLHIRARILFEAGRLEEARSGFDEAIALRFGLVEDQVDPIADQRWLAFGHQQLSALLQTQGDGAGALVAAEVAVAAFERVAVLAPDDRDAARDFAEQFDRLAQLNEALGDREAAARAYDKGEAAFEALMARWPEDFKARLAATYLLRLGINNDLERGATPEARRRLDRALALCRDPAAADDAGTWIEVHALLLAEDARLRWREDDRPGAIAGFEAALAEAARLAVLMPANDDLDFFVVQTGRWLVEALILSGERERAEAALAEALETGEALASRGYAVAAELANLHRARDALAQASAN